MLRCTFWIWIFRLVPSLHKNYLRETQKKIECFENSNICGYLFQKLADLTIIKFHLLSFLVRLNFTLNFNFTKRSENEVKFYKFPLFGCLIA